VAHLHFCEKSVKTGAADFQEDVLQGVVKPLNTTLFNGQKWFFQQDPAPAHNVKTSNEWVRRRSGIYQRRGLAVGESRPETPGL
jgi:hypothetical protein